MDLPTETLIALNLAAREAHEPVSYRLCSGDYRGICMGFWPGSYGLLKDWLAFPCGWDRAEVTLANGQTVIVRPLPPSPVIPFHRPGRTYLRQVSGKECA